ncbi:MAG: hypothetical protein AAGG51_26445 [Cyanobacteria bacterium P01_G01_bin.54]
MDALQQKIITLHEKVDALYGLVEHTHQMVSTSFSQVKTAEAIGLAVTAQPQSQPQRPQTPIAPTSRLIPPDTEFTHKDVLPDDAQSGWEQLSDYNTHEQALSPELQIRRLTAQVTAAYSRIAALEEQLLARRKQDSSSESDSAPAESVWPRQNL